MRRPVSPRGGGSTDELVTPDDRLKPGAAPATGFSLSSGPRRVA